MFLFLGVAAKVFIGKVSRSFQLLNKKEMKEEEGRKGGQKGSRREEERE